MQPQVRSLGSKLHPPHSPQEDPDVVLPPSCRRCALAVTVRELNPEHRVRESLDDRALDLDKRRPSWPCPLSRRRLASSWWGPRLFVGPGNLYLRRPRPCRNAHVTDVQWYGRRGSNTIGGPGGKRSTGPAVRVGRPGGLGGAGDRAGADSGPCARWTGPDRGVKITGCGIHDASCGRRVRARSPRPAVSAQHGWPSSPPGIGRTDDARPQPSESAARSSPT